MAPKRRTSLSTIASTRVALLLGLVAIVALVFSSTSTASSLSERLFSHSKTLFGGVLSQAAPESHSLQAEAAETATSESMTAERHGHTATRLADGRILIAGGENGSGTLNQAELYDPAADNFSAAANMTAARSGHSATRLADGRVLIAGGNNGGIATASTEIFDPATGVFTSGPAMSVARAGQSATLLNDGRVLLAGGDAAGSAEMFDPSAGTLAAAGNMGIARSQHSAARLQDGRVLLVGGRDGAGNELSSGEIFDTNAGTFGTISNGLKVSRVRPHVHVLFDGKAQIIGGNNDGSMEIYDPLYESFGAYAHVLPENDPCTGLQGQILNSQTRAALFHNGQADALLDRSGHTISELTGNALVLGGVDSNGAVLGSSALLGSASAAITTDKMDYAPGEIAHISGRGFQAGEVVRVKIHEDPHTPQERGFDVTADVDGSFSGDYLVMDYDLDMKFLVGARGLTSGQTAQTTFTDARNLVLTFAGTGSGTVTITASSGTVEAPVSCGGTGSAAASQTVSTTCLPNITTSVNTATVTFNANANAGSTFAGWSNPNNLSSSTCTGTTNPCSAVLGPNPDLTVTFNANVTVNTTTAVTNANATYGDTSVTLNATVTPASGPAINSGSVTFTVKQGPTTIGVATTDNTVVAGAASVNYALPAGTNAGAYTIEAVYTPGAGFNGSNGSGSLTIDKRAIEVTADAGQSKTYGDADPVFTYTITSGSLVAPDAFTGALSRDAGEDAGLYAITIGTLAINDGNGGNNYDLSFVSNDFEIQKRAATWTTNANSKTYGDADPSPITTGSGSNFVVADGVTATYARESGENASPPTYHITATLSATPLSALDNYIITNDGAEFTINKRAIEVTADAGQSKTYGDVDPTFAYTLTSGSLAFTDSFTGALSRVAGENVGFYAITIGTLTVNDGNGGNNYDLSFVSNDFEIKKRAITVTADPQTKTFGDPDPVFTYQITSGSLAFTDSFTGALTRDPGELVGTYAIKIGTLAINDGNGGNNYMLTFVGDNLTILTACSVFNGFLQPIGGAVELGTGGSFGNPVKSFKLNSTIPVKFNAICFGVPLTTGIHTLQAIKYSNSTTSEPAIDATPTDSATTGNQFRLTDGDWHFNLSTKGLGANGQGIWLLKATLFDGSTYTVWVSIKK